MNRTWIVVLVFAAFAPVALGQSTQPSSRESEPVPRPLQRSLGELDGAMRKVLREEDDPGVWAEVIGQASVAFWGQFGRGRPTDEVLDDYVAAFGRDGWQTDLKLTLMGAPLMLPGSRPPWEGLDAKAASTRLLRQTAEGIARRQVERFQKDPAYLDRIYRLALWSGQSFGAGDSGGQVAGLKHLLNMANPDNARVGDRGSWWRLRDFTLVCHAIGRDDLAVGVKPENFPQKFQALGKFLADADAAEMAWVRSEEGSTWTVRRVGKRPTEAETALRLPDRPFADQPDLFKPLPLVTFEISEWKAVQDAAAAAAARLGRSGGAPAGQAGTRPAASP